MIEKYENHKYLNLEERAAFKNQALLANPQIKMFSLLLYYTGIRVTEELKE